MGCAGARYFAYRDRRTLSKKAERGIINGVAESQVLCAKRQGAKFTAGSYSDVESKGEVDNFAVEGLLCPISQKSYGDPISFL